MSFCTPDWADMYMYNLHCTQHVIVLANSIQVYIQTQLGVYFKVRVLDHRVLCVHVIQD